MLLSIDGTFLVQILNLIVFWALLNFVFIAPTRRAIEARQRYVESRYEEADNLARKERELREQAEGVLERARRSVDQEMRAAATQASDEVHAIEHKASEEAAATVALAHATVADERAQALAKQGPFVEELARTMTQQALDVEQVA